MPGEQEQPAAGHTLGLRPDGGQLDNLPTVPTPVEAVQLILTNQAREHDIREREIALEQVKVDRAYTYAEKALIEQSAFLTREGGFRHRRYLWAIGAMLVFVLTIVGFIITLALTGHEALAKELCKDAVLLLGGGVGGYGAGRARSPQSQPPPAAAPSPEA